MRFLGIHLFSLLIIGFSDLQARRVNDTSLNCLLKLKESINCDTEEIVEFQSELDVIFYDLPNQLGEKLLTGFLPDLTADETLRLPASLLYFLPINKLRTLSGTLLASLLIVHQDDVPLAKKILESVETDQQRTEFFNCLTTKVIGNDKILDFIGETVYKWNYDVMDGKFQKLSNILCGYALPRLWAPYVLTRTNHFTKRLLNLLTEVLQKQNHRVSCNNYTQITWKNLPQSVRKLWSFLAVNQSFPSPLNEWTIKQIAQYKFWLPDLSNDELHLIPFDELAKMELHDIDFDNSQARFLFSWLMENSTLKDVKILYPSLFFKLSPLQINQFEPEEWANEKAAILSLKNTYLSYTAAKQIFNKIASDWLSSKTTVINGWTSKDLRHLPLLYTQPATSFLKFCSTPPSIQSLIAVDSCMLTDRQAFYLSGCSSTLSFHKNDPKLLLGMNYMIKAVPVASLLNIDTGNINYQVVSHLVSMISDHNLPMALHLLNITNPVKRNYFVEEMLKNKNNILFEQLAPLDVPGPIFDVLKHLYSNYSDRIDILPMHILNSILEDNELLMKWTENEFVIPKGLYNGCSCNFIKTLNNVKFIVYIGNYNAFLKKNGKAFPKNLQTCVSEAFINYLSFKSKLAAGVSITLNTLSLESWEIEAVQGYILTTFPIEIILNSTLRDNILYSIGQLSFPELMVASPPQKLFSMVEQYIKLVLKNGPNLSYKHLYTLGNLIHFIPTAYLDLVDEQAFKIFLKTGLFDTRMCVDSMSKYKWANLIIKAFGNVDKWSSDILVTLSDLLIVLNHDQLNSIPKLSRLNSADIIKTQYAAEIEWLPYNIPFYKGCNFLLDDQNINFTNSLSDLTNFHLASIQNQVQMISPINDNHQYEEIIKSTEAKPKIMKPSVLIPVPEFDHVIRLLSPNNLFDKFFGGKKKQDMPNENIHDVTPPSNESLSELVSSQKIEVHTKSPLFLEVQNLSTAGSFFSLDSLEHNQNLSSGIKYYTENSSDLIFIPLSVITEENNLPVMSNISRTNYTVLSKNNNHENPLTINADALSLQGKNITSPPKLTEISELNEHNLPDLTSELKNRTKLYGNKTSYEYSTNTNDSITSDVVEISIKHGSTDQSIWKRKKRSFELFFISDVQIGCEALKILGPISVTSMKFNSIVYSLSDEELQDCIDLLGSFDLNSELARHIWSKTKDKTAIHTYGSVLSGLLADDIKSIGLDINSPWSLELINLLSKHVKTDNVRKEIIKQFMTESNLGMLSHLWGSFGSLLCHLQPRTFKIIMPNKELFWKTSSAFNTIRTCDIPCIKNLASIAVSVIGPANSWKTAEVERMGIILSGINTTQWQLLLNFNTKALEGLSPVAVQCLDEPQIKLLNISHLKHLTPKSAHTLWKTHLKLLDSQSKEMLNKLVNFEIEVVWQSLPAVLPVNTDGHKHITNNNAKTASIFAPESTNHISSNEMQADSKAAKKHMLPFSILLSTIFILIIFK